MASDFTPIELHVNAIRDALNPPATASDRNRVEVKFGERGQHEWGCPRRILFEPTGGDLTDPMVSGKITVAPNEWAKPKRACHVDITAHIVAESHTAMWVLWNALINASDASLNEFNKERGFNMSPDDMTIASHLSEGARCMTQDFTWTFHLFERTVPLPGYGEDVTLVRTGRLVQAEAFTNVQDYLEHGEPDPE